MAVCSSAEARTLIVIPTIFRNILECSVDLHNLVDDPKYIHSMQLNYHQEWLNVIKTAGKGNPYLTHMAQMKTLKEQIKKLEDEIKDTRAQGGEYLSTSKRFNLAGMKEEYQSIYNFLCCDSHNNIRALISRHIDIGRNGSDFEICLHKNNYEEFNHYYGTIALHLLSNGEKVHELFKSDASSKFSEKAADFQQKIAILYGL